MVAKKKPAPKPAPKMASIPPDLAALDMRLATITDILDENGKALRRIASVLEKIAKPPVQRTVPDQPVGEPADERYMSGQWHRRSGDVYASVAEPGTPNAGESDNAKDGI